MPFPASRLADETATGDLIVGPGAPTIIIGGMPASCMGDAVAGAACEGDIIEGSPTTILAGRPATRMTSAVTGVNPESGVPVETIVAVGFPSVLFE